MKIEILRPSVKGLNKSKFTLADALRDELVPLLESAKLAYLIDGQPNRLATALYYVFEQTPLSARYFETSVAPLEIYLHDEATLKFAASGNPLLATIDMTIPFPILNQSIVATLLNDLQACKDAVYKAEPMLTKYHIGFLRRLQAKRRIKLFFSEMMPGMIARTQNKWKLAQIHLEEALKAGYNGTPEQLFAITYCEEVFELSKMKEYTDLVRGLDFSKIREQLSGIAIYDMILTEKYTVFGAGMSTFQHAHPDTDPEALHKAFRMLTGSNVVLTMDGDIYTGGPEIDALKEQEGSSQWRADQLLKLAETNFNLLIALDADGVANDLEKLLVKKRGKTKVLPFFKAATEELRRRCQKEPLSEDELAAIDEADENAA